MKPLAVDPVDRFLKVAALTAPARPELAAARVQDVIAKAGADEGDQVNALAKHVASHSSLTEAQAKPIVKAAVAGKASNEEKAKAASPSSPCLPRSASWCS